MPNSNFTQKKKFIAHQLVLTLFFIYIILFEFILPINKILPKPSVLLDSISSLFLEYNFISEFLFTFTSVYIIILISYFLISIFNFLFIRILKLAPQLTRIFDIGKYILPLLLVFLFEHWFEDSTIGEYLFIMVIVMGQLKFSVANAIENVKEEYLYSAMSLGLSKSELEKKIIWSSIRPEVFRTIQENHTRIVVYTIVYEYICQTNGIGNLLTNLVQYNDFSIIILIVIFLIFSFYLIELALKKINEKFFFWCK